MEENSDNEVRERLECNIVNSTKKRKKFGRITEVSKRILQSNTIGPNCNCSKLVSKMF